jgi:putative addiction module killer protein
MIRSTQLNAWFEGLRDPATKARVAMRIDRLALGNPGQHRHLSQGVSELKIDIGPGYRIYYSQRGSALIILLCAGDKSTQAQDIADAIRLIDQFEET